MERKVNQIETRIERALDEQVFPGCVVGMVDSSGSRTVLPFGQYTFEPDAPEVREHTVYDIASITKAIPVSSLALQLLEQEKLHLSDRLIQYVPEFNNPDRESVLISHLLTHTLPFRFPLSSMKNQSPEAMLQAIFETPFKNRPGSVFTYSNATSILLGLVIERICGESIDVAADRAFFTPLHMKETTFHPLQILERADIVPTEIDDWRGGVVQGEVHDESAWALPWAAGSAGLFSTVPDLLIFLNMLLNCGTWRGMRFFSEETVRAMSTNQISQIGSCTGLGWELNQQHNMGRCCSDRTIGKTGFTGCMCICDLDKGLGMVLLSNCTYPKRKPDKELINSVRRDIADLIFD